MNCTFCAVRRIRGVVGAVIVEYVLVATATAAARS